MKEQELLERIKQAVVAVEPGADVILYGSRARRDATEESDWDLLILVDGHVSQKRTDQIRHKLYKIEWETGEIISSIVRNRAQWNDYPYKAMSIHHNIELDGIFL